MREEQKVPPSDLAKEIEVFVNRPGIPTYLSQAIDAVRNIGNSAAHPLKYTNTGEVVDVESGEAEWLIEVMETLFDFTFVQPKRLEERREKTQREIAKFGKADYERVERLPTDEVHSNNNETQRQKAAQHWVALDRCYAAKGILALPEKSWVWF